jgi:hypothetical protein
MQAQLVLRGATTQAAGVTPSADWRRFVTHWAEGPLPNAHRASNTGQVATCPVFA